MKTILVPTDGSQAARKALGVAFDLAEKHNADIKLLHVLLREMEPDELLRLPGLAENQHVTRQLSDLAQGPKTVRTAKDLMSTPNAPDRPAPEALLRMIAEHVLGQACAQARNRDVAVEVLEIADGAAAPAIKAAAEMQAVDTIVMGMRGLGQIEATTFGSVSQEVCREIKCTCVAVH